VKFFFLGKVQNFIFSFLHYIRTVIKFGNNGWKKKATYEKS